MDTAAHIATLYQQIEQIEAQGEVAAANTWISSFVVPKPNGKHYTYYRLMEAAPKSNGSGKQGVAKMKCYLGTAKSPKYKRAMAAIARRNQIQVLTKQIKQLEALALKEEKQIAAATAAPEQVSGGNLAKSSTQPPLTNQPTSREWQQLQQELNQLNEHTQQLIEVLNQERAHREAMTQEITSLKAALGK
ncbi:hypothetical protein NIES2119_19820 [[Phormidium ambiguum] IAM M-71]|uniref:Uncharacterized protein n=1 Tax=[Phormidium ambiguum] IAM M-71 TaxID=454136 RepID=A0A1U7IFF0_9CYAN|nr:hypothetical protein [Phormidium ambiguum]OKH35745.1 hypothetical protein NIES2119_19820 [Phormidium ambiguum IAM M-71]